MVIGFIGLGNMASAMVRGIAAAQLEGVTLCGHNPHPEKAKELAEQCGLRLLPSNQAVLDASDVVVLAVKPQYYDAVLKNIKYAVKPEQIVISIAPGITIDSLVKKLGDGKRIVRAMPNTPALLGEGMTGVTYDRGLFTEEEEQEIRAFFQSFGRMEYVEERLMSAVVCASGSSPAYVYMFIEALADSAVRYGLPRDKAYEFRPYS